jgi:hypothetical protein
VPQWARSYSRVGNEAAISVIPVSGAVSGPEYILGGYATGNGNVKEGMLMKANMAGDTVWVRSILSAGSAVASVKPTVDGNFIACGLGSAGGTSMFTDALLCRFTTAGSIDWLKFHGGGLDDGAFSVAATADGGFAVTGFAKTILSGNTTDIYLAKTDKMGDLELVFDGLH